MGRLNRSKRRRIEHQDIAKERISILFTLADNAALAGKLKMSDLYVKRARNLATKFNVRLDSGQKRKFCKYCYAYLLPSVTSIVRTNPDEHRVETKCLVCGKTIFYPYVREQKIRRKRKRK